MKIMFCASDNINTSGAFRSMTKLISLLQKKYGVKCIVVLPWKGSGEELLKAHDIEYVHVLSYPWIIAENANLTEHIKILPKLAVNEHAIRRIMKLCRDVKPDIVHINTSWSYVGAIAARRVKIPVIWHIREYLEEDQGKKIWFRNKGYKCIDKSQRIITISNALEEKYKACLSPEKIIKIYNGIDVQQFYCENHRILCADELQFSCVGGLYPGKGQKILIQACKIIYEKGVHHFILNIVGKGSEEAELKELANRNGLQNNIIFRGYCATPEDYYKNSDIVFMTSKSEAFGRVTIEAMLSGALVIGSDSGATTELLHNDDYGYLYECGNPEDLANKILYAIQNKEESCTKAKSGQEMARQNYTAELNAERIFKVYNEIINDI